MEWHKRDTGDDAWDCWYGRAVDHVDGVSSMPAVRDGYVRRDVSMKGLADGSVEVTVWDLRVDLVAKPPIRSTKVVFGGWRLGDLVPVASGNVLKLSVEAASELARRLGIKQQARATDGDLAPVASGNVVVLAPNVRHQNGDRVYSSVSDVPPLLWKSDAVDDKRADRDGDEPDEPTIVG